MENIKNKDTVKCVKDFYSSLPLKVALDNHLNVTPSEMYLLFKEGEHYEVSHEYKTSEEDRNYFRYVASKLKYEVNGKKNVYERFVTRKSPINFERTFNFYEFFEMVVNDVNLRGLSLTALQRKRDDIYNAYQHEPNFIKAKELIPLLDECDEILNEKKEVLKEIEKEIKEEQENDERLSHLN